MMFLRFMLIMGIAFMVVPVVLTWLTLWVGSVFGIYGLPLVLIIILTIVFFLWVRS